MSRIYFDFLINNNFHKIYLSKLINLFGAILYITKHMKLITTNMKYFEVYYSLALPFFLIESVDQYTLRYCASSKYVLSKCLKINEHNIHTHMYFKR